MGTRRPVVADTCTWSQSTNWLDKCGKPAVVKLPIGISGQLTTFLLCEEHKAYVESKGAVVKPL